MRAVSSVGSEHLVYTQRVGGSNPSLPTDRVLSSVGSEHLVYTQRVRGSNPLEPTKIQDFYKSWIFLFLIYCWFLVNRKNYVILVFTQSRKIGVSPFYFNDSYINTTVKYYEDEFFSIGKKSVL